MTSKEATPPATEATAEPTLHDTINEQFKVLQTGLTEMFKMSRNMQDQLKALQKSCRQVEKKTRVSAELSKFLSQKKDVQMTKADVMKQISGYIKKENLQLQNDKRKFLPNKALAKLFGLKAAEVKNMTFVEINKHVSQHLTKA